MAAPTRRWGSAATSSPAALGSRPPPTKVPPAPAPARRGHGASCPAALFLSCPEFSPEDKAKSLLHMISNDIGQLACLYARLHGLDRVYFGGFFIRGHPVTMRTITYSISFFSKVAAPWRAPTLGVRLRAHPPGLLPLPSGDTRVLGLGTCSLSWAYDQWHVFQGPSPSVRRQISSEARQPAGPTWGHRPGRRGGRAGVHPVEVIPAQCFPEDSFSSCV